MGVLLVPQQNLHCLVNRTMTKVLIKCQNPLLVKRVLSDILVLPKPQQNPTRKRKPTHPKKIPYALPMMRCWKNYKVKRQKRKKQKKKTVRAREQQEEAARKRRGRKGKWENKLLRRTRKKGETNWQWGRPRGPCWNEYLEHTRYLFLRKLYYIILCIG